MKIRRGFVSNSSSSSFILDKKQMTDNQMEMMRKYINPSSEWWDITEDENEFQGYTLMDNGDMRNYFKKINLLYSAVILYEEDS